MTGGCKSPIILFHASPEIATRLGESLPPAASGTAFHAGRFRRRSDEECRITEAQREGCLGMCPGGRSSWLGTARRGGFFFAAALLAASALASESGRTAYDLSGKAVDPFKASRGKLVVLLFVRTDCPISNRYAPAIQRMSAAHASAARFWLVYPDKNESPRKILAHDRQYGYTISTLRDPNHTLVRMSQVTITPEAAVFTADGRLVYHGRVDNWFVDMGRARSAPTTHELEGALLAATRDPKAVLPPAPAVGCYISDLD